MDFDILSACEDLVSNILRDSDDNTITDADIERWQDIFSFTPSEAINEIREWRSNFARPTISDQTWSAVKYNFEPDGYDKEAYEYATANRRFHSTVPSYQKGKSVSDTGQASMFLVKLEGPFADAESLRDFAMLPATPLLPVLTSHGRVALLAAQAAATASEEPSAAF